MTSEALEILLKWKLLANYDLATYSPITINLSSNNIMAAYCPLFEFEANNKFILDYDFNLSRWSGLDWICLAWIVMAVNKPFQNIDMIICLFIRSFPYPFDIPFQSIRSDSIQFSFALLCMYIVLYYIPAADLLCTLKSTYNIRSNLLKTHFLPFHLHFIRLSFRLLRIFFPVYCCFHQPAMATKHWCE